MPPRRKAKKIEEDDFDDDEVIIKKDEEEEEEYEKKKNSKKRVVRTKRTTSPIKKQKVNNNKNEDDLLALKEHLCGEAVWLPLFETSEHFSSKEIKLKTSKDEGKTKNFIEGKDIELDKEEKLLIQFEDIKKKREFDILYEKDGKLLTQMTMDNYFNARDAINIIRVINKQSKKESEQLMKYELFPRGKLLLGMSGEIKRGYRTYVISSPYKSLSVSIKFYFNIERLKFLIKNGFSFPLEFRKELFKYYFGEEKGLQNIEPILEEINKESRIPIHIDSPMKQPDQLKEVQLYRYQLNALTWMKRVEEKSAIIKLEKFLKFNSINGENIIFSDDNTFRILEEQKYKIYQIYGGIYADEMGLGKTLVMISLILSHPKEFSTLGFIKNKIESKATFVLCPNHLTKQWEIEINRATKGLKIIIIQTKLHWNKVTYRDLMYADIVIVSLQFLENKCYQKEKNYMPTEGKADFRVIDLMRRENAFETNSPMFHHFQWHRVIIDEAHEIINHSCREKYIYFTGTYTWVVSGTPISDALSVIDILEFLSAKPKLALTLNEAKKFDWFPRKVLQPIFWRNTKMSVGDEFDVPFIVEEVVYFELSDVERGMYLAADSQKQKRQICCHPQISSEDRNILGDKPKKLEEIREEMITHKVKERTKANKQMMEVMERLEELMEEGEKKKYLIDAKKVELAKFRSQIQSLSHSISYFESISQHITQSTNDPCSICLDQFSDISITSCGHLFCYLCIKSSLEINQTCPLCRSPLSTDKINRILDEQKLEKINNSHDLIGLISKYGSKMAKLITMIKELFIQSKDNRIIIFSQWDKMLHRIGDTLSENNISHVYCQGSVFKKWKAIRSFRGLETKGKRSPKRKSPQRKLKNDSNNNNENINENGDANSENIITEENKYVEDDEVRVIMLSLENAASGTNLTEATHIFLMDPVAKGKVEAKNIEAQAIGRAMRQGQKKQITVVRLLAKNTIEEEIYTRNYLNEDEDNLFIDDEE